MSSKDIAGKEVVSTAKKNAEVGGLGEHVLSTGVRVRIVPVGARLLTESMARVPEPEVPMFFDEHRQKEIPNPDHPSYTRALEEREMKQTNVAMDALIMFGVELMDGVPNDDRWVWELRLLEKVGALDLSIYDLDDEIDKEFLYKKFIAVAGVDLELLQGASGLVSAEDLAEAEDSFRGDEGQGADIESED